MTIIAVVIGLTITLIAYAALVVGGRADDRAEQRAYLRRVLDEVDAINERDRRAAR